MQEIMHRWLHELSSNIRLYVFSGKVHNGKWRVGVWGDNVGDSDSVWGAALLPPVWWAGDWKHRRVLQGPGETGELITGVYITVPLPWVMWLIPRLSCLFIFLPDGPRCTCRSLPDVPIGSTMISCWAAGGGTPNRDRAFRRFMLSWWRVWPSRLIFWVLIKNLQMVGSFKLPSWHLTEIKGLMKLVSSPQIQH